MTRSTSRILGGKSQQFSVLGIDTIFKFCKPKPPLSEFVDSFWLYEGQPRQHKTERILPTAERRENCSRFSGAVVSGAHGQGFTPAEEAAIIGLHFKPGGAFPFLGLPAGELAEALPQKSTNRTWRRSVPSRGSVGSQEDGQNPQEKSYLPA